VTDGLDRRGLRDALVRTYPWVADTEVGPRAVEAGECDRCARRPRCVPTCGPVAWTSLCADCAVEVGDDGWCDGHVDDGRAHRAWARRLPPEWPTVVRLWWAATGEVDADDAWLRVARAEVAATVGAALPGPA
jgi:hypothetical protein